MSAMALALGAALLAQAAPAAAPAPPAAASTPAPGANVSQIIVNGRAITPVAKPLQPDLEDCSSQHVLGTLLPKKICATAQEIAQRKDGDQAELRRIQSIKPYAAN